MNRLRIFYIVLPILLTVMNCLLIMVYRGIFASGIPLDLISHITLVILGLSGIVILGLKLSESGVVSPNLKYSITWGIYLSISVCIPALIFIGILHMSGIISLRVVNLYTYRLITALFTSFVLGGLCEEFFYRGFVQGSLNKVIGDKISPILTGVIFGLAHLSNYVNLFTGEYGLSIGAIIWILISCFVGMYFGFLRRKCGDIYCSTIFHGSQDFTSSVMSMLGCSSSISIMALGIGWIIFLGITYRQFKASTIK